MPFFFSLSLYARTPQPSPQSLPNPHINTFTHTHPPWTTTILPTHTMCGAQFHPGVMTRMAGNGQQSHHRSSGGGAAQPGAASLQEAYETGCRNTMSQVKSEWERAEAEASHRHAARLEEEVAKAYAEGKATMEAEVQEREAAATRAAQEQLRVATLDVEAKAQAAFRTRVDEVAAQKYFAPRSVVACTVERERCIDCYRETGDGTRQYALHCHGVVQQYAACAAAEKMRLVGKSASASTSSSK